MSASIEPAHADYPHWPGALFDCPACEASCHCTPDSAECVYEGERTPTPAPSSEIIAEWTDSSGYYRVTVNPERTELRTYYAPDDTSPATSGLTPAPDYAPIEPWWPAGDAFAVDYATSGDYVSVNGIWYVTA